MSIKHPTTKNTVKTPFYFADFRNKPGKNFSFTISDMSRPSFVTSRIPLPLPTAAKPLNATQSAHYLLAQHSPYKARRLI
jgi:hypothetical protein